MKNKCVICKSEAKKKLCGAKECRSEFSRMTIANTFKKNGGKITQFRKTNGMSDPATRAKVSTKLRAMGWKPVKQGGNGKPFPIQQVALASCLGWKMELAVATKMPRSSGYPSCYKLDIGEPNLKVGIEVDGNSHNVNSRKIQDKKKVDFLNSLGWIVLRFTNREVEINLQNCVQTVLSTISKLKTETPISQTES